MASNSIFRLSRLTLTIPTILNSATVSPTHTRLAHAYILKSGLLIDNSLSSKLLSFYANHQCFYEATIFLDSIDEPTSSIYSIIINAFSKFNLYNNVLHLFSKMLSMGVTVDSYLLAAVPKSCAGLSAFEYGRKIHGLAYLCCCSSDKVVQSSLVHMYVKCGWLSVAHKVLDKIPEPDVVCFSAIIAGYARNVDVGTAKKLFYDMEKLGLEPNLVSWNGLIAGFNQSGGCLEAINAFRNMHLRGFQPDGSSFSSVIAAIADLE